jgi:transposase
VRSTWAPKGQTPVLRHRFSWSKISVMAALAYRWDGKEAALVFGFEKESYNTETIIEFLEDFREHFPNDKITLIWDRLPAHRSAETIDWIAQQRKWLMVEYLPPYGHDLNPWAHVPHFSGRFPSPILWIRRRRWQGRPRGRAAPLGAG